MAFKFQTKPVSTSRQQFCPRLANFGSNEAWSSELDDDASPADVTGMMRNAMTLNDMKDQMVKLFEKLEAIDKFDRTSTNLILNICNLMKSFGQQLDKEVSTKNQLDTYFNTLRNVLRRADVDILSRARILELIEIRAGFWMPDDLIAEFYERKLQEFKQMEFNSMACDNLSLSKSSSGVFAGSSQPYLKSPAKSPSSKAFLKDEVVIRNCDSGKVMGIRGRRVHLIEELSDTIISFQRVSPNSKERVVQISGSSERNINRAKELIETTIQRNSSPDPYEMQSYETPNQSNLEYQLNDSEVESAKYKTLSAMNEGFDENSNQYHFVIEVNSKQIVVSTSDFNLGSSAKKLLEEHFLGKEGSGQSVCGYEASDSSDSFDCPPQAELPNPTVKHASVDSPNNTVHLASSSSAISPAAIQKSSSSGSIRPLRPMFSRTVQNDRRTPENSSPEKTLSDTSSPKAIITYDRNFLMDCKDSPLSKSLPSNFWQLLTRHPSIIKEVVE